VVAVNQDWPVAELDPVRRMRVIAAATPGVAYAEKLIPAPFSAVWETASDLEHELPRMVTEAGGTRFAFLGGLRLPGMRLLDPVLRPAARPLALRPIRRLEHQLRA
jgi:hypothetical protein